MLLAIFFGLLTAGIALTAGYANLTGRPMLTGEKNRLAVSDPIWLSAGIGTLLAGLGVVAGWWMRTIGVLSGFLLIAIAAAAIWFQQQGGDRLLRSLLPVSLGLGALLYVIFLLTS